LLHGIKVTSNAIITPPPGAAAAADKPADDKPAAKPN
jgi:carboxyl-terminal processing protease